MRPTMFPRRKTAVPANWKTSFVFLSTSIALLCASLPAAASDGVLEIDQSCAPVGCFEGDAPGWPVTLAQPGSYRLTSPLDLSLPGGAIEILADGTTVDLNGFAIRFCVNPPPGFACLLVGQHDGIEGAGAVDVTVRNGLVQGFRGWGVDLNMRAHVEDLAVRDNELGGIRVGSNSLVQDNRIAFNGGTGAQLGLGSGWGDNVLISNAPDWTGAPLELSRNVCSGDYCVWEGPRRYYLTPGSYDHSQKDNACAPDFRVAHASEMNGSAALSFDESLAGSSFPSEFGGWVADPCLTARWETDDGEGSASLNTTEPRWVVTDTEVVVQSCNIARSVWCIEE